MVFIVIEISARVVLETTPLTLTTYNSSSLNSGNVDVVMLVVVALYGLE